jgi:hypothetical protein
MTQAKHVMKRDLPLQIMSLRLGLMHIDYADTHIVMSFGIQP